MVCKTRSRGDYGSPELPSRVRPSGLLPTTASRWPPPLRCCPSSEQHRFLTRAVFFWYFGTIMLGAAPALGRFTGEGRTRPGRAATLLLR
jgi:hypothetical protein